MYISTATRRIEAEKNTLSILTSACFNEVTCRLNRKANEGFVGWDNESRKHEFVNCIRKIVEVKDCEKTLIKKKCIDIMVYAMFFWNISEE